MKITGKEGGPIDRDQARKWTANYRASRNGKTNAHLFGAETVKQLLAQENCVGMRIYYALDDKGEQQLLLVGTDSEGNDMTEGLILDLRQPLPARLLGKQRTGWLMEFFLAHIYPSLRWVAMLSPLLPFAIGLWLIRKQKDAKFMLLLLFITIGVLTEAVSTATVLTGTRNNLWLAHVYTLLGFSVLAGIYYHSFNKKLLKRTIMGGVAGLCILVYYDAFITDGLAKMNSVSRIAANAMLIIMAITYFYKVANNAKIIFLDRDPIFLLSCAILIYYAGTSMSYAIFNEALAISNDAARICVAINMVLLVLFYTSHAFILRRMAA